MFIIIHKPNLFEFRLSNFCPNALKHIRVPQSPVRLKYVQFSLGGRHLQAAELAKQGFHLLKQPAGNYEETTYTSSFVRFLII